MTQRSQKDESPPSQNAVHRAEKLVGVVISGRYRIVDVLAVGGMGVVYRGQHVHMRKRLAMKILLPETKGLPNLVARFEREAVVGAHVTHPNIASATDFGKLDDGSYFLVLEFARGITLSELIKQGPMELVRAARITRQLASALDAAHSMGVIHRDLKPRNVMIDVERGDFVKLIDFGLAKAPADGLGQSDRREDEDDGLLEEQEELTTVGVVFGTVAYMSPEAALGMVMVDHRSDLYALGMMFYEMLAGRHAWDATDPIEPFRLQRMVMPPAISVRTPSATVPPAVESLIMQLLQKQPDARFQSAQEFIAALDEVLPEAAQQLPQANTSMHSVSIPAPPSSARSAKKGPASIPPSSQPPVIRTPVPPSPQSNPSPQSAPSPISTTSSASATTTSIGGSSPSNPAVRAYVPVVAVRARRDGAGALVWTLRALSAFILIGAVGVFLWRSQIRPSVGDGRAVASESVSAPPVSASPTATVLSPAAQSAAIQARAKAAVSAAQWDKGADALLELVPLDPAAFKDKDVAAAAVAIATAVGDAGGDPATKLFGALSKDVGVAGLDILYTVSGEDGKDPVSESSKRALDVLGRKEILEKAPPAMRVAVELRRAPCMKKVLVFNDVKLYGDMRSVNALEVLRARTCKRKRECCFTDNNIVDDVVKTIQERSKSLH